MGTELRDLGDQLKSARKSLGLTQVELAALAGVSYRPIYQIEDGKSIRLDTLIALCDAMGLTVKIGSKGGTYFVESKIC